MRLKPTYSNRPMPARRPTGLETLTQPIKRAIVGKVVAVFNDQSRGETPVVRRPDGLFGPRAVAWRVNGDVTSMMVGGVAGLMMQMLHPAVLGGVWDHSRFRDDMRGRLRRTARFIALTTYGDKAEAMAIIERVRQIHTAVRGVLPDGTAYAADDPDLLAWVHVTETVCFLDAWIRYAEPGMTIIDQDKYFDEMAVVAVALGADPVPRSRREATKLMRQMRPALRHDARTREVAHILQNQPADNFASESFQALTMQAAVDLLPDWALRMHNLGNPLLARPLVRAGTFGVAQTLRWAFR
ncbi:MAG: oxygenase MpaB family protein [Acidocella sp.]|nr:oxygenase MpaB family protein [Acidocella sp.]